MTNAPQTASRSMTLAITPIGKGRPLSVTRRGKSGRMVIKRVTEPKTKTFEQTLAYEWLQAHGRNPLTGACRVGITARFAMPSSWSAKKREATRGKLHTSKPDLDNIQKTLDALNGLAWVDDAQVGVVHAIKIWSDRNELHLSVEDESENKYWD